MSVPRISHYLIYAKPGAGSSGKVRLLRPLYLVPYHILLCPISFPPSDIFVTKSWREGGIYNHCIAIFLPEINHHHAAKFDDEKAISNTGSFVYRFFRCCFYRLLSWTNIRFYRWNMIIMVFRNRFHLWYQDVYRSDWVHLPSCRVLRPRSCHRIW